MAVRVFSNDVRDPMLRAGVQDAVVQAIGERHGDWLVQIHEENDPLMWAVIIWGPSNYYWIGTFFAVEIEPRNSYFYIRNTVAEALRRPRNVVYISYAYPDNSDGFVGQLKDRLAQQLQVLTGEPSDVLWDGNRMQSGAAWSPAVQELVERATFMVPVISPSYLRSDECRKEFEIFLEREQRENRPLMLPVYFVTAEEVENGAVQLQHEWVQSLMRHNLVDLRPHRFDLSSPTAVRGISLLAGIIQNSQYPSKEATGSTVQADPQNEHGLLYVNSVRLTDFRCFERIELQLNRKSSLEGRWTCIAGINGSGKSTILQAIGVALLGNPLATELGGNRLDRLRRRADLSSRARALVELDLRGEQPGQRVPLNLAIDDNRIVSRGEPPYSPPASAPSWEPIRSLAVAGYGATRNLSTQQAGGEQYSADVRHQITLFDPLSRLSGADVLTGRGSLNLPALLLFENVLRKVFGDELQLVLGSPVSGVHFSVFGKDTVEAIDLPDGFRSTVAWLIDLCSLWCAKAPNLAGNADPADIHAIVLIDEIDLHLHPSLQRSLIPKLRSTFPKVQWIVTTHSPLVLANFDRNEIIALDRDQDGNIRELDRQVLSFTSDEIYDWLMGTKPTGTAFEEEIRKSDQGAGRSREEIARLMRESPKADEQAADQQVEEFKSLLKSLKR